MSADRVQEYIATKTDQAQLRLNELRNYLLEAIPNAGDELTWGKPALVSDGILVVYAAAKKHISLHPTLSVVAQFSEAPGIRVASQNTIHFSIDEPIPKALVMKIAQQRLYEKESLSIKWK